VGLQDETPMAAQAAVGVSVSGAPPENGIVLETDERARLVADLLTELVAAVPGSAALLRGSLAEGRADPYSDIDLLWEIPDADFSAAIAELPVTLERVGSVASLRFDPDFQRSTKRRLAFIRFAGVPLFWRVDLNVFARSVGRDPDYDRDNPSARGAAWSLAESSLANAIAAIKALRRGRDTEAAELLARAEARVGVASPDIDLHSRISLLVDAVAAKDPTTAALAADIHRLVTEMT
jgi:predicted nucleotidyltransferase